MEVEEQEGFWGKVELFGHQQIAGFVIDQTIGGETRPALAVPEPDAEWDGEEEEDEEYVG
jgi:hypothetical protein